MQKFVWIKSPVLRTHSHPVHESHLRTLTRHIESGFDVIYTGIWYTFVLFLILLLVWEFGHIVYTTSSAFNAARAAAQEAAKCVDRDAFINNQVVILDQARAEMQARQTFESLYGDVPGTFSVIPIPASSTMQFVQVNVEIQVKFSLVNSLIGDFSQTLLPPMNFSITAYGEPAYGINGDRQ